MRQKDFRRLWQGAGLFIFSLLCLAVTRNYHTRFSTTLPFVLSWVGIIYVIDWADHYYLGKSFSEDLAPHVRHRLLRIAAVAIPFGFIIEGYGVYFLRLWYYPYWSFTIYSIAAPFAFIGYTYILFGLYDFVKNLIHQPHKVGRWHNWQEWLYGKLMWLEVAVGGYLFIVATAYEIGQAKSLPIGFFDISKNSGIPVVWWLPFAISFAIIFIFDFVCFRQHKETLTKDVIRGYFSPILVILIANIIAVIAIEFFNGPFRIWRFANWPFENIQILNVPLIAIIVWPLQFFGLLTMLRAAFTQKQIKIW